jgi:archaeal flagellar protein FlaJ
VLLIPLGVVSMGAEKHVGKKDDEIAAFFRSIGGTASSRGTTLGEALRRIEISSFPALEPDIKRLGLRLKASAKPETCWRMFAAETGSRLITQSAGIFYESTNLGGDPETAGMRCSLFSSRTAMLRAKRRNVAETFSWLTLVMHAVVSALMVFILEILKKFLTMIQSAMPTDLASGMRSMGTQMLAFNTPQVGMMEQITIGLLIIMAFINAFAVIASEGAHILKATFYLALMFLMTGISFIVVPNLVNSLM